MEPTNRTPDSDVPSEQKSGNTELPNQSATQQQPGVVKEVHHYHHHETKGPGLFRLLLGLFIVLLGLGWLSSSLGWQWGISINVFRFWPVLIIFFGLSLLSRGSTALKTISAVLILLIFAFVAALMFWPGNHSRETVTRTIDIDHETEATQTDLTMRLGAVDLELTGSTDKAVAGSFTSPFADLIQTTTISDERQHVTLSMEETHGWWMMPLAGGTTKLSLRAGSAVPLNVELDGGAMDATMDFTGIPLKKLDVDSGATTFNLTLGDILDSSDVSIDAGASTIRFHVPKTVGVRLALDSALTTKHLSDFKQIDDTHYESDNIATATKMVTIDLKLGASTLTIDWL